VATHCADSDCVWQFGNVPPLRTSVAQQSGVLPGQSAGFPHASVFAGSHVGWHDPLPELGLKQQTPLAQGQVPPASLPPLLEPPELLLLDPLLLPDDAVPPLLPLDPLPVPLELLVLPDPLVLPEPLPPLPLPELDPFPPSSGMVVPLEPLQPA
jgi:hypothetical protein